MSSSAARYALYVAPAAGDPLHRFAARWLGWDAETAETHHPTAIPGFDTAQLQALTAEPRRYGFHGTLKPPFRLADGRTEAELMAAIEAFASTRPALTLPPLQVAALGSFLALIPSAPCAALDAFAADCVREFDFLRAPAGEAELAKRRAVGLTARQEEYLRSWGYPYVLEEFRLHFTLTGRIKDPAEREALRGQLAVAAAPLTAGEFKLAEICLFVQQQTDAFFRVARRFPLSAMPPA